MNKRQIKEAMRLVDSKTTELKEWIALHHDSPYREKVLEDIRQYEREKERLIRLDEDTYPSADDIVSVSGKEILVMYRAIRQPRNAEERAVYDKICERVKQYTKSEI